MKHYLAKPDTVPSSPFLPSSLITAPHPVPEAEISGWNHLYKGLNMSEFGGVSVLILNPDALPRARKNVLMALASQDFETFMMDFIPKEQHCLIPQFSDFEGNFRVALREEEELGFIPPCIMHGDGAALIVAAGSGCTPERILQYSAGLERCDSEPLLEENNSWRYYALFHELAHVIGANEPQADHIAALFCRRAYPDSAAPRIEADMRALEAVLSVTLLATGQAEDPDYMRQSLIEYGWNMVVANDLANDLPDETAAMLSDKDIFSHRKHNYEDNTKCLFRLGVLIRDSGLDEKILSGRTDEVLCGAQKLLHSIDKLTNDPEVCRMAARFAAAAGRIHRGARSYVKPPVAPNGIVGSGAGVNVARDSGLGGQKAGKPHPFTGPAI